MIVLTTCPYHYDQMNNKCSYGHIFYIYVYWQMYLPCVQVKNNKHKHIATSLAIIASLVYLGTSTIYMTVLYIHTIVA